MTDAVNWDAVAAGVLANFEATGQWFVTGGSSPPEPVNWDTLAAQVLANFAATGQWFLGEIGDGQHGGAPPAITRASIAAGGEQVDGFSFGPSLSADGGEVAFASFSDNLVPGDTGLSDIFVKDLSTGAVTRASAPATDEPVGGNGSFGASLSADGRKVAFYGVVSNLVPGDTNDVSDVFVKDLDTGAIARVSTSADGEQGNGESGGRPPSLSADGSKVVFSSTAGNLVPGDTNDVNDVFVKDLDTGAIARVSTSADGEQGNGSSFGPSLSADGSKVAFASEASNLVDDDTNGGQDIFVKDLSTGAVTRATTTSTGEQSNGSSFLPPALSADGTRVAFSSTAGNLVPDDANEAFDVFVKDLSTGAITHVSTSSTGESGNASSFRNSLSADGTRVAFSSTAGNLVPGDTNDVNDVFVKDLTTGAIARVSTSADGELGNGQSDEPSLSADGSKVAFASEASNLVPGDTNGFQDVFVRDLSDVFALG